jgi:riboflavin biosynthesis pyrimidine reductase
VQDASDSDPGQAPAPARLRPLLPAGEPLTAAELVEQLGLWRREPDGEAPGPGAPRPRVLLNMVASADGRATLAGRSGGLSSQADRELFHALRACSDAVLVGAGTVRAERYGPIVREPDARRLRAERGLPEESLACIVSAALGLDPAIPLLAEPGSRVVLLTQSDLELAGIAADVSYIRRERGGTLDLGAALSELHDRFGVRLLLCEGGPHLGRSLLAGGLLDELYLSVAPTLAGGDPAAGPALRIFAGEELDPAARLSLQGALADDSHLFLRYAVVASERASRETTSSSSLAR